MNKAKQVFEKLAISKYTISEAIANRFDRFNAMTSKMVERVEGGKKTKKIFKKITNLEDKTLDQLKNIAKHPGGKEAIKDGLRKANSDPEWLNIIK